MNLQRYRHFLAVAEAGHIGRAAERLGMRQPPLSQSLQRLERDLGVALLERTPHGVRLTAAGAAFRPEAQAALAAAERAAALARAAGTAPAPVRVGAVSLALVETLPSLLAAARDAAIPVSVHSLSTNEQLSALADGRLDLGLVTPPFEASARLRVVPVADEPILAALPAAEAGPAGAPVALEAIHDRLVLFPRADGPALHDAILALFRMRKLTPRIVQETPASMLTTLALVGAGIGVSFVPAPIARTVALTGVAFRPLAADDDVPGWPVALAHMPLATRSPAARLVAGWRL